MSAETLNVDAELTQIVLDLKRIERQQWDCEDQVTEAEIAYQALEDQEREDLRMQGGPWPKATNADIDAVTRNKYRTQWEALRRAIGKREAVAKQVRNLEKRMSPVQTKANISRMLDGMER